MGEYQFRFLTTPLEAWEEGRAMRHCAYDLVLGCETGVCWVISVTKGGARVATLELRRTDGNWRIHQLAGKANARCNVAIWSASLQLADDLTVTQDLIDYPRPLKPVDCQSVGKDGKQCSRVLAGQTEEIE